MNPAHLAVEQGAGSVCAHFQVARAEEPEEYGQGGHRGWLRVEIVLDRPKRGEKSDVVGTTFFNELEDCAMKNVVIVAVMVVAFSVIEAPVRATSYHATVDIAGLIGMDVELEINLYDNSGTIGDSWALIDNLFYGSVSEDFETGDIGGFDDSLNPASVYAALGNLDGSGSYVLRIDENPTFNPTITWRDFVGSTATTLEFDFAFFGDAAGADELVFSLLDPVSLAPLVTGLTPGFGDFLAVHSDGVDYTDDVTVSVVPEPLTLLGVCMGIGGLAGYIRTRRDTYTRVVSLCP